MSDGETKKPGFFGRLFGSDTKPSEADTAPDQDPIEQSVPASADTVVVTPDTDLGPTPPADIDGEAEQHGETAERATGGVDTTSFPAPPDAASAVPDAASDASSQSDRKTGWFGRLTGGLSRTSSKLTGSITGLFTKRKLDAEAIGDLEDLLLQADLGVETTTAITGALAQDRYDKEISSHEIRAVMAEEIARVLTPVATPIDTLRGHTPHVVLVVGVNGSGKTTTIGKLGARLATSGQSVMLAAGDTFRAAAIEQLKIWGGRIGAPVIAREQGSDAASLAFEAIDQAVATNTDVLLIDTAGRLQNKADLMAELEKVVRVIQKKIPDAPHDVVLVLDATVGQNALNQVEVFRQMAGVTGIVMTKLDGTARGGILVAIAAKHALPIHAIGVGEAVEDFQPFDPQDFARAIAGLTE